MTKEIIPWQVFLEALSQRPKARLGEWLATWRFADDGAFPQPDQALPAKDRTQHLANTDVELSANNSESRRTLH